MMSNTHTIENSFLRLTVSENGGAVSNLMYLPRAFNILRPARNFSFAGESGLFPMLPMANRVSGNHFHWQGNEIKLPLHNYNDTFFIHGDGWLNTWYRDSDSDSDLIIKLRSTSNIEGVCSYSASLCYMLHDNNLSISLRIKNEGDKPFPFGGGFHPFFTVYDDSKLTFDAQGMWLEDSNNLPIDYLSHIPEAYNFQNSKRIPEIWINNGYRLGDSCKVILEHQNATTVRVSSPCHYLQVYKPQGVSSFICLEPQSHYVDAHSQPNLDSLTILDPRRSMEILMTITVDEQNFSGF